MHARPATHTLRLGPVCIVRDDDYDNKLVLRIWLELHRGPTRVHVVLREESNSRALIG